MIVVKLLKLPGQGIVRVDAADLRFAVISRAVVADRRRDEAKKIYDEIDAANAELAAALGIGAAFQDEHDGVVYKVTEPTGTFVSFKRVGLDHTRRATEHKGSLSLTEAKELGFDVPSAK